MVERANLAARGFWVTPSAAGRRIGRAYFAVQAFAGAIWWVCVFALPAVREATLGRIDPVLMGIADMPLFVLASAVAAAAPGGGALARRAAGLVAVWAGIVTAGLAVYATVTGLAGWGAVVMIASSIGSACARLLVVHGRMPADSMLAGPLGFGTAGHDRPARHLARTLLQMSGFWLGFLVLLPAAILALETRWGLHLGAPAGARAAGAVLLLLASALGLWSACTMSLRGDGTPLPSAAANRLVIAGPYRRVRNPMAVAGIAQAIGVGLIVGSWAVIACALCGALYWNLLVRPWEEADLEARFGAEFADYRARVRCWVPRLRPAV